MNASAIIVAAGSGSRLGFAEPKAFVALGGRSMLHYSLATIAGVAALREVVIAVPAGMEERARVEAQNAGVSVPTKITAGGLQRQDSVRIALALTSADSEVVVVHDAARPFADRMLFERCLHAAARSGGAIAAIPVADTLKRAEAGRITATVARDGLFQAQTPQAFQRDLLIAAHRRALEQRISATDDADLVEQAGERVEIVEASALNLKITTTSDLAIAEALTTRLH
jgi:2-C-methyl-D-erythritol 4-phosphate cytidylyltransferase